MKAQHNAAVVTYPGFEDITVAEVNELTGAKATAAAAGIVTFKTGNLADLCKFCYLSQSASAVLLILSGSGSSGFCGIAISPFDLSKREYRIFSHSSDIKGNLAYLLLRAAGYAQGKFLFDPFTRSGTVAIEAAIFSSGFPVNYYRKESLSSHLSRLQPFSNTDFGSFFADADAKTKKAKPKILSSSPSMQYVRSAEKNAKIAGVNKLIRFSRLDIEWLDAKLDEFSVDLVVSYPPQFKNLGGDDAAAENKKLAKLYKDFFYQADFFLSRKGEIVLLLKKGSCSYGEITAAAATYKFAAGLLRSFKLGSEEFELVSFAKA